MTPISKIRYNCEFFCCTFSLTLPPTLAWFVAVWRISRRMFTMYKLEKVRDLLFERRLSAASDDGNECNFMDKFNAFISLWMRNFLRDCSLLSVWKVSSFTCACWGGLLSGCGGVLLIVVLLVVKVVGF